MRGAAWPIGLSMGKGRITGTDIRLLCADLREYIGFRVANVYDLDGKTYMFKLSKPDKPKIWLLVESGQRFHVTKYSREKNSTPSGFTMKVRAWQGRIAHRGVRRLTVRTGRVRRVLA